MKNKSIVLGIVGILAAVFMLGVTGSITLAKTDEGADNINEKQKDRLVGVFITREHLNLFDFESYFEDNAQKIISGGVISAEDSAAYEDRLYATLVEKELTNEENGEVHYTKEHVFEGVEGFLYYAAKIQNEGESYYTNSGSDEAISDGHIGLSVTDEGETVSLEGTIYMSVNCLDNDLYFNPVYQTADGAVYTVSGTGRSYGGEITEGMRGTSTLDETTTYTANGETVTEGAHIEITHSFVYPPVKIVITQMDKNNQIVESGEYEPGKVPKELVPKTETDYIIVETFKKKRGGEEVSSREMYQKEDTGLETLFCREDGICIQKYTSIRWQNIVSR